MTMARKLVSWVSPLPSGNEQMLRDPGDEFGSNVAFLEAGLIKVGDL